MTWGQGFLTVAMISVCGFLMLVILIQRGRGSGLVGAFGGGALEGAKLFARNKLNEAYYGPGATPRAIVIERGFFNPQAEKLRKAAP